MHYHPRVLRLHPGVTLDGRKFLDVVTGPAIRGPIGVDPAVAADIKKWATAHRDKHHPGHEIRYDWEANA